MTQTTNNTTAAASNTKATTKVAEKYTAEQTKQLLALWKTFCEAVPNWATVDRDKADQKIVELAEQFQKKTRSIIAKLTRHEKYIAKTTAKNSGSEAKNKAEISEVIGKVLNLSEPETESLNAAGKQALQKIMSALSSSVPIEVLTPTQQEEKTESIDKIVNNMALLPETIRDLSMLKLDSLKDLSAEIVELNEALETVTEDNQ